MIGTDAMSSPLIELDSLRSAWDRNSQGRMISTQAKMASQRQCGRSTPSSPRRSAIGSRITAPPATRASTSTGTDTPPSATLMSRYGTPQIRLIAVNSTQPRRLNPVPPHPSPAGYRAGQT